MLTVTALVCSGTPAINAGLLGADDTASCQHGYLAWQQVIIQEPFDPSTLDSTDLAGAFGAGFTVMATGLVIVWAGRQIIKAIRTSF